MRYIDGKTRVCGLIGNPVEHTLSPVIHNTLAEELGINEVYVPFLTQGGEAEVKSALEGAFALNILGLNVTVPHKQNVLEALCGIDPLAAQIGAVNTLVRTQNGYFGHNTDMTGLYRAMLSEGIRIEEEQIILLGAGGAARAVAFMLAYYGADKIYMLNRTKEKAQQAAQEINLASGRQCVIPMELAAYRDLPDGRFLAVQGTSVGLAPDSGLAVIGEEAFYRKIHTGYDLIYRPGETKFMSMVRAAGGTAYNGLKMLLYQGVDAFELWNGVNIEEALAMKIYTRMERELGVNE